MAPETVPVEDIKEHLTLVKFILCNSTSHAYITYNLINRSVRLSCRIMGIFSFGILHICEYPAQILQFLR